MNNSPYPNVSAAATNLMHQKNHDSWLGRLGNDELHMLLCEQTKWTHSHGRDGVPFSLNWRQSESFQIAGAPMRCARFMGCTFVHPQFIDCDLRDAAFIECRFAGANFNHCDLRGATFQGCDIRGARFHGCQMPHYQICPEEGEFVGWKKLAHDVIAKLKIPAEARRTSSLVGRKCRAEFVKVLEFQNVGPWAERVAKYDSQPEFYDPDGHGAHPPTKAIMRSGFRSLHDPGTVYVQGQIVRPDKYDDDFRVECTHGIHFFMTRQEAMSY